MIRTDPALTKLRRQKRKVKAKLLGLPRRRKRKNTEDEAYQSWVRTLPCCVCNAPPPSESCHVRRASRSGTGFKGWMCSVPMCHSHHAATHQHGESAVASKKWFDEQVTKYLALWRTSAGGSFRDP